MSYFMQSRRQFLTQSLAGATMLGTGTFIGSALFADRIEIAAKIADLPEAHPLLPALKMGSESLTALADVKDYQALFVKREMIGRRLLDSKMQLKFRAEPFSVYLKCVDPNPGREVIYVDGVNNNMLQVHDTGFAALAGTLSLDPSGKYAMDGNRYPLTRIGLEHMTTAIMEQWLAETKMEDVKVNLYPKASIGNVSCKAIESSHSSADSGAKYQMTRFYIDNVTNYPVRVQQYEFPQRRNDKPALVEDYLYSNLTVNVGLKDIDFNINNPQYDY